MPLHATKFNMVWLEKLDSYDIPVKRWLKQGKQSSTFICTICNTDELSCANKGWQSIEQHMNNKKHIQKLKLIKENSTFTTRTQSTGIELEQGGSLSTITLTAERKNLSFPDQVSRAEALWAMNAARQGYSYY